ncbi:MAG: FKBP-type peptidyl-prolyl cis-trans isomerase [Bacteroidales bacterium]|nr:FKBP-type peptidyl-prolyl cis-trans isomerase [Bacteroidales bacterium]
MIIKKAKNILVATLLMTAMAMTISCGDDFKKTEKGLYYSFEKENPEGQKVKEGDVLFGEMTVKFDTMTLSDNSGKPGPILPVHPYIIDPILYEGLLMLHVGDEATFSYDADSLANLMNGQAPHPNYKAGTGQKITYKIKVNSVIPWNEYVAAEMKKMKDEEPVKLQEFLKQNNINVEPTADSLYIITQQKGKGAKVTEGKEVTVHYTGRLLDGTVFDSSVERGTPFTFHIGANEVIPGWDKGLQGQTEGSKLQLIIPSSMGYGERGSGIIPPYATLVFDVEIISVK